MIQISCFTNFKKNLLNFFLKENFTDFTNSARKLFIFHVLQILQTYFAKFFPKEKLTGLTLLARKLFIFRVLPILQIYLENYFSIECTFLILQTLQIYVDIISFFIQLFAFQILNFYKFILTLSYQDSIYISKKYFCEISRRFSHRGPSTKIQ